MRAMRFRVEISCKKAPESIKALTSLHGLGRVEFLRRTLRIGDHCEREVSRVESCPFGSCHFVAEKG